MRGLNQAIRSLIPEILIDWFDFVLFVGVGLWILSVMVPKYFIARRQRLAREKWKHSPKDVVILHSVPRGMTVPQISPFALKLETYLRMAKIPYEFDDKCAFGDKGKTPWVTLNGVQLCDSQLIIEHLEKKFEVKLGNYNELERAQARVIRILIEDHIYWGGLVWRFSMCDPNVLKSIYGPLIKSLPWGLQSFIWRSIVTRFRQLAWGQGMGRHSQEEVTAMMSDSMKAFSTLLGDKKFILGDEPCAEDAAVFGLLAEGLWASPGAPFHKDFKDCPNLEAYTKRMRERFWPDWESCLNK